MRVHTMFPWVAALAFACAGEAGANQAPRIDLTIGADGKVWGWAYDPDAPGRALAIHFYVDGDYRAGTFAGGVQADLPRDDVRRAFGVPGDHGFEWSIPTGFRDGRSHTLFAYAVDGAGGAAALYPWLPRFRLATPQPAPGASAPPPTPGASAPPLAARRRSRSWSPGIRSDRHAFYLPPPTWLTPAAGRDAARGPGQWTFCSTNEDWNFSGGSMSDLPPGDPTWQRAFHPRGDGSYQVGLVVDKVNTPRYLDRYTFAGFCDSFDVNQHVRRPDMSEDLSLDVSVSLHAAEALPDALVGHARVRVMVGATLRWGGQTHFVEVNLFRTDNFDLVDASTNTGGAPGSRLDPQGIYDRHSDWGAGELVYYDGARLDRVTGVSLAPLGADGRKRAYTIPLARLVRAFAWTRPPVGWHEAELAGIYVGLEVWGRGRLWIEISDYDLYTPSP